MKMQEWGATESLCVSSLLAGKRKTLRLYSSQGLEGGRRKGSTVKPIKQLWLTACLPSHIQNEQIEPGARQGIRLTDLHPHLRLGSHGSPGHRLYLSSPHPPNYISPQNKGLALFASLLFCHIGGGRASGHPALAPLAFALPLEN